MLLLIISFLIITAYTAAVCIKTKGVPYSISATYYALDHKLIFGASMALTAMFLFPVVWVLSTTFAMRLLAIAACIGLIGVGSAPNFKDNYESKVHTAGAITCIAGSQLWIALNFWPMLLVWLAYVGYTALSIAKEKEGTFWYKFYQSKPMFWIEIAALLSTYFTMLFNM